MSTFLHLAFPKTHFFLHPKMTDPQISLDTSAIIKDAIDSIEFLPVDKPYVPFETVHSEELNHAYRAALAHKTIRQKIKEYIKPGTPYTLICELVERMTTKMLKGELNDGLGFPTGISVNHCAAHYSCPIVSEPENNQKSGTVFSQTNSSVNSGENEYFKQDDVIKIDFGTHSNGLIIDSAFTVSFNDRFDPLLEASKQATEQGIKYMGIDTRVSEIGREIAEVMKSFEMEDKNGNLIGIGPVRNLNGHSIAPYKIHAGISIPNIEDEHNDQRILPDKFYALETFATTGHGIVRDGPNNTHFMMENPNKVNLSNKFNKNLLTLLKKQVKTLPFSQRFIKRLLINEGYVFTDDISRNQRNNSGENQSELSNQSENDQENVKNMEKADNKTNKKSSKKGGKKEANSQEKTVTNSLLTNSLATLSLLKVIQSYPPLYDSTGSHVSQFEHTIFISEEGKYVVSRGEDY